MLDSSLKMEKNTGLNKVSIRTLEAKPWWSCTSSII